MLPILGAEPTDERLVYACGHSKNGSFCPATAISIAAVVLERSAPFDLTPFRADRFTVDSAADLA
jgi:glycine/D-amino acid oxidase-like deaminating enzyme